MLLLATGCATSPPIIANAARCSELVPDRWREGVQGAPAPDLPVAALVDPLAGELEKLKAENAYLDALGRGWMRFGVAQTERLAASNGRFQDALGEAAGGGGIVGRCEDRQARAIDKARPKFLGVF